METSLKYRTEIDGLRAVAVLPVVFFHAGFTFFSGGYLGVDVFFVISGYLITTIIFSNIQANKFSFFEFYLRRTKRIIPALFFVLIVFLIVFWVLMLPWDYENYGAEVVASVLFSNNIFHYITSANYWGTESDFKALLHTWSLGIEEQFYIFFPLLALFMSRLSNNPRIFIVGTIILVSLLTSVQLSSSKPMDAFFLLPFRVWELLAGSVIALYAMPKINNSVLKEVAPLVGLLLIVMGMYLVNENTIASSEALYVVVGSMLIIYFATHDTFVGKLLSFKPFVWIGMISFSLYLWHQPVFVTFRLISLSEPSPVSYIPYIVLSIGLSIFSYKYIETFFRFQWKVSNITFLSTIVCIAGLLVTSGYFIYSSAGISSRWSEYNLEHTKEMKNANVVFNNSIGTKYGDLPFPRNKKENVLVVGNSFARDFINSGVINNYFKSYNLSYIYKALHGCTDLKRLNNIDIKTINLLKKADHIIFASGDPGSTCINFFRIINDAPIIIIGPKNFGWSTTANLLERNSNGVDARVPVLERILIESKKAEESVGSNIFVNTLELIADQNRTVRIFNKNGKLLSFDTRHLTPEGAIYLGKLWFNHHLLEKFK